MESQSKRPRITPPHEAHTQNLRLTLTDEVAIRVHVRKRSDSDPVTEDEPFPEMLGGVPVDVIEATYGLEAPP
jgi:hypothetical protein